MPIERLIDLALAVVAAEVVVLLTFGRRFGMRPIDVMGQLLAGVCLMIAVRCAVSGADRRWTLVFLSASFPAHLFDLVRRRASRAAAQSAGVSPASPELRPPPSGRS